MLFTEPTFLFLFLPVLLALYFVTRVRTARYANWLLLVASIIFYAKGGGVFTWLMLGVDCLQLLDGDRASTARRRDVERAREAHCRRRRRRQPRRARRLQVRQLLRRQRRTRCWRRSAAARFALPQVLLPIGISFFTFHAISYVVDVYRGDATAQKSPVHAALYLLLFPQLIAGPIIRYQDIADQLARRVVTLDDFAYGVRRFIIGLGKKVLIANIVAGAGRPDLRAAGRRSSTLGHAWLGIVCYTLQIYFDFSGYSDMAIGLGRMFGFRFPENFRWPYIAQTGAGILAALAHVAVVVVPRLPVRPARRQPRLATRERIATS